jgi:hypothetical protein
MKELHLIYSKKETKRENVKDEKGTRNKQKE